VKLDRLLVTIGAALFAGLAAANDISGVVSGPNGPEAGVWVIAETTDLPTKFARIVVTDDQGRYLVPDLPQAGYEVWVRGYGLVDSPKVKARPPARLDLAALPAPAEKEAAQYYPPMYWFALMRVPQESEFPIGATPSQAAWVNEMKQDLFADRGGARGLGEMGLKYYAQWAEEVEKGALPFARPERPKGAARNLVVTLWDWSGAGHALEALAATDRRNPRLFANGRLFGAPEEGTGLVPMLDPKTHSSSTMAHPLREASAAGAAPAFDEKRQVWFSSARAPGAQPDFCKSSGHPSAKAFPLESDAGRQLSVFDPKHGSWKLIRTCFPAGELQFGFDDDNTLWSGGGGEVLGWFNRYIYERTGDEAKAQGWTPFVLDTSGDGKRGAYVDPDAPLEPSKDRRLAIDLHSAAVSPLDGTVWGTVPGTPGGIVRVAPGANPAFTALSEYYEVPAPGYGPRGGDIDTNGVYWVALASGHLGRFVRANCKVLNGPRATGKHCPEGWTFYQLPGPQLRDVSAPGSAEVSYTAWVDWSGILGLGRNVPIAMGNGADAVHALVKGEFVTLYIPYPQGAFPKGIDGRIDNESAGWKGRGLWTTSAFRGERGNDERPKVVKLQMRPNPLAK